MSEVSLNLVTAHTGSAHVTADDLRGFNFALTGESGIYPTGNAMKATQGTGNVIYIADGEGLIQGAHFRIEENTQKEVTISTGDARYDLIVVHYHYDASTKVNTAALEVLEGTSSGVPSYTEGNLREGDTDARMPLYLVHFNGTNIDSITSQFSTLHQTKEIVNMTVVQATCPKGDSGITHTAYDVTVRRTGNMVWLNAKMINACTKNKIYRNLFTIPSGYRPVAQCYATCMNVAAAVAYGHSRMEINTTGIVTFITSDGTNAERFFQACWITADDMPS